MANEKAFAFFGVVILLLISGCNIQNSTDITDKNELTGMQKTSFTTEDGIRISANYWPSKGSKGIVLLHMLGRNKESWGSFAEKLNKAGYNVLAIDMRGHGESAGGSYGSFTAQQWLGVLKDIKASKGFLIQKGVDGGSIYLIGGSIGANLSLNYAVQDSSIKKIILLSPGLDYRGVTTLPAMQKYRNAVFLAASSEDVQSFVGTKELYDAANGSKEIREFNNAGHGTNMLGKNNLDEDIIAWLNK